MKKIDWSDLIKRAGWTFLEAFIVAFPTAFTIGESGWKSALWSAILSACAAGVSAVKTLLVQAFAPTEAIESVDAPVINAPAEAITNTEAEAVKPNGRKIYLSPSAQYGNTYAYGNTNEGTQCELIAEACATALLARGFSVMNGAKKDYEVRVDEAKAFAPDLYMPIHTNAFNGVVTGTRMFVRSFEDTNSLNICKSIFGYLDAFMPGTSSNIKEHSTLWEFNATPGIPACYAECDFHDVPEIARFIISNTTGIGEAIAHGICDAFGVAW